MVETENEWKKEKGRVEQGGREDGEGRRKKVAREKNNNVSQPPKSFCAMLMKWV